ncbi:hypothetical protein WJX72_008153 [[Myrmecia] bisecta]|uniref:Uncharacterized protein n=1 Tax=[Myrmecia] bisecta TaxID=41462 RepID=A0AAW1PXY2_9CHLO
MGQQSSKAAADTGKAAAVKAEPAPSKAVFPARPRKQPADLQLGTPQEDHKAEQFKQAVQILVAAALAARIALAVWTGVGRRFRKGPPPPAAPAAAPSQ